MYTYTNKWELESNTNKLNTIWLFRVMSDNWGDDLIAKVIKKQLINHLPRAEIREISVKTMKPTLKSWRMEPT